MYKKRKNIHVLKVEKKCDPNDPFEFRVQNEIESGHFAHRCNTARRRPPAAGAETGRQRPLRAGALGQELRDLDYSKCVHSSTVDNTQRTHEVH